MRETSILEPGSALQGEGAKWHPTIRHLLRLDPGPMLVTGDTSVDDAHRLMDDNRVRHLPVLDAGRITGILSDRDLLEATGWLPARVHVCRGASALDQLPKCVYEIMREPVLKVGPGVSTAAVSLRFLQNRIGCMPVVRDGLLVGIVTEMDLLELHAGLRAEAASSEPISPPVACFMSGSLETVPWDTSLGDAIDICRARRIRHLPVVDEHGQIGLVSDRDLRRACGSGQGMDARLDKMVTRQVIRIRQDAPITRAAHIMAQRRISSLPVLEDENLVGIITSTDVLEYFLDVARGTRGIEPYAD